jgi:uncharacterized Fe-S cluster-containing radical SAM superfamily enzyme
MKIIDEYLDIVCKNALGEVKIYADDYDESTDEIRIRTNIRDDQLNRGWIGDLTYSTRKAYDIESCHQIENIAQSTHNDVLLASVTVYSINDRAITWEYRFLKK